MEHGGNGALCGRWRGRTVHIVPMVGPGTCFGCLGRSFGPLAAVHGAVCDFATPAALCVVMVITDRYVREYVCVVRSVLGLRRLFQPHRVPQARKICVVPGCLPPMVPPVINHHHAACTVERNNAQHHTHAAAAWNLEQGT